MGWFWGSTASAKPSQVNTEQEQPQPPQSQPLAQAPNDAPPAPAPAPTQDVDSETRKFLAELMGEVRSMRDADQAAAAEAAATSPTSTKKPISPWGSRWASTSMSGPTPSETQPFSSARSPEEQSTGTDDNPNNAPRLSPLAESLLPTTMDCEQAFNQAFYCRSMGGQFNHLYRYGTVRSCNEHWADFWFCMRVKGYGDGKVKEDHIRDHYRQKELAKYGPGMPSSNDVWRERKERVKPGEAFSVPVEPPTVEDAEFQKWEMERMERIRRGLREKENT